MTDEGEIVSDQNKVSLVLIKVLRNIQLSEDFEQHTGNLPFPELPALSQEQAEQLLNSLASGKAVSFDLFSDIVLIDKTMTRRLVKLIQNLAQ